jgi:transporter family-2 protein
VNVRIESESLWVLMALAAGTVIPLQVGVNAGLAKRLGHPLGASVASFVTGALASLVLCLIARVPAPSLANIRSTPLWLWSGGIFGAILVGSSTFLAPKLGASVLVGCIIASQLFTALVLDHYGVLGFRPHPITPGRLLGSALLLAGMALLRAY